MASPTDNPPAAIDPAARRRDWLYCAVIAAAVLASYLPAAGAPFVFDSRSLETSASKQVVQPLWRAVTRGERGFVDWTFAWNYRLGGLEPRSYRLTNIAIHIANALLLMAIARGVLTSQPASDRLAAAAPHLAFAIALLWAVHPLATQGVTYVIQRYELVMSTCLLLTLLCVQQGLKSRLAPCWYAAAILCC
ncbi:MAG: hypothetical protein KDA41_14435, partial [Planctomycetales bacterium]|nr:hypothetical protein [Planctomycetales bacterium]